MAQCTGRGSVFVLASMMLVVSARSVAMENEPDGFAQAKFGMSAEAVRKVFPEMKELAEAPSSPLRIYAVENQSFKRLRPCKVTFSFLTDKLYETKLDCGSDETVKATLHETFGQPSVEEEKMAIWRGERAVVSMNLQTRTFAFANVALVAKLNQYLLQRALIGGNAPAMQPPADGEARGKAANGKAEGSTP